MRSKIITLKEAVAYLKSDMSVMFGGFLACGGANNIVDELTKSDVKNLTIIANDTTFVDKGLGKLVVNKQVKKAIVSHIGTNKETGNLMNSNELIVELSPQGTLVERIRAGGFGLGGILTPTGIGTEVAEGKQILNIDGKDFLLEKPITADIAYLKASKADKYGNLVCNKSTKNFNIPMAYAGKLVIAEVEEIVEVGEINPDDVDIPHVLVDYIVKV